MEIYLRDEMAEEYIPIPLLKFLVRLSYTPPPILRISVVACVSNRDYLDSLSMRLRQEHTKYPFFSIRPLRMNALKH